MSHTSSPPLSSRARVSLAIARGIAAARGDDDVSPAHIALGLLHEGENAAVATLHHAGADLHALRSDLESALGPEGRPRPGEVSLPSAPGESLVLTQAATESQGRHAAFLGPHHLLLALLRDADGPVARVCARHGINYETGLASMRRVFEGALGDGDPSAAPAPA